MKVRHLVLLSLVSACAPDECFSPRSGDEATCEVVDTNGVQWDFHEGQPIENLDRLCKASCIDAPEARINIASYSDLRKVPLLAKLRTVQFLDIDVEKLTDLHGLEGIDIGSLTLATHGGDLTSFKSLDGLTDRDLDALQIDEVFGVQSFDGARFSRLGGFFSDSSGLRTIDLSSLTPEYVSLSRLDDLSELSLGGGTLKELDLLWASTLTSMTWQPDLKVRSYNIQRNSSLSSCLVQRFLNETDPGVWRDGLAVSNGPCP